jgi:putative radical SAM enzyme (TIGR03279 family)
MRNAVIVATVALLTGSGRDLGMNPYTLVMPTARVLAVAPGSPAHDAGLLPGDELLALNGEAVRDVIRYQIQSDEPHVELELRRGGLEQLVVVDKRAGVPLGLELQSAVFDRVRTCDNHCPFCFIYQLPKRMRRSLYVKDDDYRLSFLYGNFTTLTRFTEADYERVVTEHLGPLYVSIHATDPELRAQLLRNRRGATSLRWLGALLDAGVEIHGQIVVCPGINDGDALDDTMLGIFDRFPQLASVGVVPLGVSAHTTEPSMRAHSQTEARRVLTIVECWQARFVASLGRRLAYASDEYYLLAEQPFPVLSDYDDFPQHENGVGMARRFEADVHAAVRGNAVAPGPARTGFFAWVDGAPAAGYRAPRRGDASDDRAPEQRGRPVVVLTGEYGARVLEPLTGALSAVARTPVHVLPVPNHFFGGNIAVTGLLTGADVDALLATRPAGERYLLPDVVLSNGRFLDGTTPDTLCRRVDVIATDGAALVGALR